MAKKLGLRPVPFSGSRFERGREDAENDSVLAQIKSSAKNLSIKVIDLWVLYRRATHQGKIPMVVFNSLETDDSPGQLWIAFPLDHLEKLYEVRPMLDGVSAEIQRDVCEICGRKWGVRLLRCAVCHKYTGPCCSALDPALYQDDEPNWICINCEQETDGEEN